MTSLKDLSLGFTAGVLSVILWQQLWLLIVFSFLLSSWYGWQIVHGNTSTKGKDLHSSKDVMEEMDELKARMRQLERQV